MLLVCSLQSSGWRGSIGSDGSVGINEMSNGTIWFTKCCCLLGSENIQSFGSSEIFILQISCIPCNKCAFATMHTIKGGGNRFEQRQRLNRGQFISRLLITSVCPPPGFTESPYNCFLFKTQQHCRVHHLKTCSTLSKN